MTRRPRSSRVAPWLAAGALVLLGGLCLHGCSSLPRIVPDLHQRPKAAVPLEGAAGPLTAAQSKAVLDRLARGGQPTGIFDRHLAREEALVGSPLTTGNRVQLLRDTDLQLQGPVVAELQKLFLDAWASQNGPPLPARDHFPPPEAPGRELVRVIGSSPDEPFSLIYATLLSAIGSAETSIRLTNAYFVPDPQLLEALEAAVGRGVDVRLILPSQTDSGLVFHAGRSHYERLLRAGVKIDERQGVILHAKTVLIDGVWSTVGSTNLDWRSFLHNHELNAVVLGEDFGRQMPAMFDADLAASEVITLERWQRRPIDLRFKEWFSRLWAYWL